LGPDEFVAVAAFADCTGRLRLKKPNTSASPVDGRLKSTLTHFCRAMAAPGSIQGSSAR